MGRVAWLDRSRRPLAADDRFFNRVGCVRFGERSPRWYDGGNPNAPFQAGESLEPPQCSPLSRASREGSGLLRKSARTYLRVAVLDVIHGREEIRTGRANLPVSATAAGPIAQGQRSILSRVSASVESANVGEPPSISRSHCRGSRHGSRKPLRINRPWRPLQVVESRRNRSRTRSRSVRLHRQCRLSNAPMPNSARSLD
jgi:hypothetical protein